MSPKRINIAFYWWQIKERRISLVLYLNNVDWFIAITFRMYWYVKQ